MNRIEELFKNNKQNILNIYFTAGFPELKDTLPILQALQNSGTDIVEIGMPYSDPVADGETIQGSNQKALENGMSVKVLFEQLAGFRNHGITVPVVLMGYFNPVYQYGVEEFCKKSSEVGIDGLILPDLPLDEFNDHYREIFEKYGLLNIFLITPQTSEDRIRKIDGISKGFIYMVSSASVTGAVTGVSHNMEEYFERVNAMNLKNPRLIGFGIKDKETFAQAAKSASGAIIGSQFVRVLETTTDLPADIEKFVKSLR